MGGMASIPFQRVLVALRILFVQFPAVFLGYQRSANSFTRRLGTLHTHPRP